MLFEDCSKTKELHNSWRKEIFSIFPYLNESNNGDYLSIVKYINDIPYKFYSKKAFQDYYDFLEHLKTSSPEHLKTILNEKGRDISLALKYLAEINSLEIHDTLLPQNDIDLLIFTDRNIYYNYLRLTEGVYATLIYPLAYFELVKNNKKTDCLRDIFNCVEVLKKSDNIYLTEPYINVIRNGIAHGNITYLENNIVFSDNKGNTYELYAKDFINLFDTMIDYCNGIALGLKIFLTLNLEYLEQNKIRIPRQILLEELRASVDAPGWQIIELLESRITIDGNSQLMIYVKNDLLRYIEVLYFCFRTAILVEKFASGYGRYFFNLKNKYSYDGWAAFDGILLKKLRIQNENNFGKYTDALENGYVFFVPKIRLPSLIHFIVNFIAIFRQNFPLVWKEYRNTYFPKKVKRCVLTIHRNGVCSIINGQVVINNTTNNEHEFIRRNCSSIVNKAIMEVKSKIKLFNICKYLPVGYLRIGIYQEDFRQRKLHAGGLVPELICTIELKRLNRIKAPDIFGGLPEIAGHYKIVWNSKATNFEKVK